MKLYEIGLYVLLLMSTAVCFLTLACLAIGTPGTLTGPVFVVSAMLSVGLMVYVNKGGAENE